jgi:hypothetical protein
LKSCTFVAVLLLCLAGCFCFFFSRHLSNMHCLIDQLLHNQFSLSIKARESTSTCFPTSYLKGQCHEIFNPRPFRI